MTDEQDPRLVGKGHSIGETGNKAKLPPRRQKGLPLTFVQQNQDINISRNARTAKERSGNPTDNRPRYLGILKPGHQVLERGEQRSKRLWMFSHWRDLSDDSTVRGPRFLQQPALPTIPANGPKP